MFPDALFGATFAWQDRLRQELYIDTGDADENLAMLEKLRDL